MRVGVGHWELTLLWRYSALEIKSKRHQSPAAHAVWSGGPHLVGLGEHLVLCWNQAGPLQGAGDHCSCDPPAGRLLPHSHTEPLIFPHPSSWAHLLHCPCTRDLQHVPWLSLLGLSLRFTALSVLSLLLSLLLSLHKMETSKTPKG